jgi:hypothetical protein
MNNLAAILEVVPRAVAPKVDLPPNQSCAPAILTALGASFASVPLAHLAE